MYSPHTLKNESRFKAEGELGRKGTDGEREFLRNSKKMVVQLFIALNQFRAYLFIILSLIPFFYNSAIARSRRGECKENITGIAS